MKIGRQYYIGKWWGFFKLLTSHVVSYLNLVNFATTWIILYLVGKNDFAIMYGFGVGVALIGLYVFEYKYSWGSYFSVWNQQIWDHKNPQREQLARLEKKLDYLIMEKGIDPKSFE